LYDGWVDVVVPPAPPVVVVAPNAVVEVVAYPPVVVGGTLGGVSWNAGSKGFLVEYTSKLSGGGAPSEVVDVVAVALVVVAPRTGDAVDAVDAPPEESSPPPDRTMRAPKATTSTPRIARRIF